MYVAPTPFALTEGTTGQATLIAPADLGLEDEGLEPVGQLVRVEAEQVVIAYNFDLTTNLLMPRTAANPTAGAEHRFTAYRMKGKGDGSVGMKEPEQVIEELAGSEDAAEGDEQ